MREKAKLSEDRLKLFSLFVSATGLRLFSLFLSLQVLGITTARVAGFQDGLSYQSIASHWPPYSHSSVFHFPLYPACIALARLAVSSPEWAALLLSIVASSLAVVAYGAVLRHWTPYWFASAMIFAVFPCRWFNLGQLAMSENLFLLFLILAFGLMEADRHWLAGGVVALACLTKPSGLLMALALLLRRFLRDGFRLRSWAWLVPPVLALAAFELYLIMRFHDPLVYFHQHNQIWGGSYISYPFAAIIAGYLDPGIDIFRKFYLSSELIFYLGGILIGIFGWLKGQKNWLPWLLWATPFVVLHLFLRGTVSNWGFLSTPRLLLPAAPPILLFWLESLQLTKGRRWLFVFGVLVPAAFIYNWLEFKSQLG